MTCRSLRLNHQKYGCLFMLKLTDLLWGTFTYDKWIPSQRGNTTENVFISRRHHWVSVLWYFKMLSRFWCNIQFPWQRCHALILQYWNTIIVTLKNTHYFISVSIHIVVYFSIIKYYHPWICMVCIIGNLCFTKIQISYLLRVAANVPELKELSAT